MLRILHTADWHLGLLFHGYERDWEHAGFLEWLLGVIAERQPDALLLAGDVFDSVNPPASAQRRYYDFLARAHAAQPRMQMVVIAGNHDAASRLEAPQEVLRGLNISVIGTVPRDGAGEIDAAKMVVPLHNAAGAVEAVVAAIPFLRPHDVPVLAEAADAFLEGVVELHRQTIEAARLVAQAHPGAVLLAMGHCHLMDASESPESERRIVLGNAEALRVETFPDEVAYVALGHLHKPQELHGGRIRYSGSPLPFSFTEHEYRHRVLELTAEAGAVAVEELGVPRHVALLRLPKDGAASLPEVLRVLRETEFDATLPPEAWPFLEVRVLDDGPDPTRRRRVEQALEGKPVRLVPLKQERVRSGEAASDVDAPLPGLADLSSLDPVDIMAEAHREKFHTEPSPALLAALREVLAAEPMLGEGAR